MALWHESSLLLDGIDRIQPRYGKQVLANGKADKFFFREQLLELWRVGKTMVPVSRLTCSYAFEDRQVALSWAEESQTHCYEVEPEDIGAEAVRVDMLWLTAMGAPNSTFEGTLGQCNAYWAGQPTDGVYSHYRPQWEWLIDCDLKVLDRLR